MAARTKKAGTAKAKRPRPREKPQVIADEIRRLIVSGKLSEGDSLGNEPDLVERFGVSRPSLREELRRLIDEQARVIADPEAFGVANARFHEGLVAVAGNQTLAIVAEMLNEIVARAVTAVSRAGPAVASEATRRRGLRSQQRLVALLEAGDADAAEAHWRTYMAAVGRVLLGQRAGTLIDLTHHHEPEHGIRTR